jgi:hypothetical protein
MPIKKDAKGWWWGNQGPFDTKQKAVQVGQAAHAAGYQDDEQAIIKEKKAGKLTFALDYHKTYSADPKFWNVFIQLVWLRKDKVYCVSHSTDPDEIDELYKSIGKIIGKDNVILTNGAAKKPYCDKHGIDIDIWIDNNPIHIIQDPNH